MIKIDEMTYLAPVIPRRAPVDWNNTNLWIVRNVGNAGAAAYLWRRGKWLVWC